VTNFILDESGQPTQLIGVTRDISARKTAEAEKRLLETKMLQMQKMESLGLLAGGIAHDFNNFLASMLGNADLARRALSRPEEAEEYLERVMKATERAADLCQQLLAYSGKGKFVVEPVDIAGQVLDLEQLLRVSVPKSIHIKSNISEGLHYDEAIRQTTSAMLTMNGFDVPLATDGDEAVHIYRHRLEEIQAVLLDLTMPGMSGEETFAQLRAINPEVSIVLSSGYNKRETTAQLASDELATFLQKPYRIAELMHALDSVARRKG